MPQTPPPGSQPFQLGAPPETLSPPPLGVGGWPQNGMVPAGYRIRYEHNTKMLIVGGALLGLGYTATTLISSRMALSGIPGMFFAPVGSAPVIGAFGVAGLGTSFGVGEGTIATLLGLGVVQSVGLGMIIAAVSGVKKPIGTVPICARDKGGSASDRFDAAQKRAEGVAQYRKRKRMIIGGSVVLGLSYYASILSGSVAVTQNNRGSKDYIGALVPIVGPFVTGVLRAIPNEPQTADYEGLAYNFALGTAQVVGAGVLIAGLRQPVGTAPDECDTASTGSRQTACDKPSSDPLALSIAPIVTPTFGGAGITGTF